MSIEERKKWATENGIEYEVKQKGQQITVKVDSKAMEDVIEDKVKLRADLEDANAKLSIVSERLFQYKKRDLGAPNSISTPQELMEWQENQKNNHEDPVGRGGVGVVSLENQDNLGNNSEGYESEKEMIDDLRNKASLGDKNAKLILARLYVKTWQGRRESPRMITEEFVGEKDPLTGQEKGLIETMNEDFRKREKLGRAQKSDD